MKVKPQIVIAGILDTKGAEVKFIAERVRAAGGEPIVLELSLKEEAGWANVGLSRSFPKQDEPQRSWFNGKDGCLRDRCYIGHGGSQRNEGAGKDRRHDRLWRLNWYKHGHEDNAHLPIGLPKLMLSTMASGDVSSYVGTRDIAMLYPIAEVGLNAITRRILNYSAAAIVAMASPPSCLQRTSNP